MLNIPERFDCRCVQSFIELDSFVYVEFAIFGRRGICRNLPKNDSSAAVEHSHAGLRSWTKRRSKDFLLTAMSKRIIAGYLKGVEKNGRARIAPFPVQIVHLLCRHSNCRFLHAE